MGTNYYWHPPVPPPCEHCGRGDSPEVLHIGKSSAGWCFALHIIPDMGIHDLPDWEKRWATGHIEDEYGTRHTATEMRDLIVNRRWVRSDNAFDYASNHALPGPNGLCRHRIDGHHCIVHGAGTWDLMPGDFS